ncbi:hypothetical protein TI39_contig5904g00002 [Zymoseptoria brevis]|uniref:RNA ligase/cyclic nucleotide phosphodiesterase n=1 Tax=Zymoseptoria brevis TaxID=1047168 RepID=A0A0F4G4D7_9PEZI|nr:hypothetical protein TI39_contig5904g00002 [Zymoseptoria brevis]
MAAPSPSSLPTASPNNPYSALISACSNDPSQIQSHYLTHRSTRNTQQRTLLLSPSFQGVKVDEILYKLSHPESYPGYEDPRHCLVVWARPTEGVRGLVRECQRRLKEVVSNLWLMPSSNLHMTALEVTHSRTPAEIDPLVEQISPHLETIFALPHTHRVELVKPCLSFDAQAIALSFVPAATSCSSSPADSEFEQEAPTYHHLRRDLHALLTSQANMSIASRYITPSAHLTIARFIEASDLLDPSTGEVDRGKVEKLVETIEGVNRWLEDEYWALGREMGARWVVGEERGLEVKRGKVWYGGGERVGVGEGFLDWVGRI